MMLWQTLTKINSLMGQSLSWTERLAQTTNLLLPALSAEGLWLATFEPLPDMACGLVNASSSHAPSARVQLIDSASPFGKNLAPDTLFYQIIHEQQPYFVSEALYQTGSDLGDILFQTFKTPVKVIIPLIADHEVVGLMVMGKAADLPETTQAFSGSLGEMLGNTLYHSHQQTKLQHQLHQQQTDTAIVNRLVAAVNAGHGLSETAKLIVEQFRELFEFKHLSVSMVAEINQDVQHWVFNEYGCGEQPDLVVPWSESVLADLLDEPRQGRIYDNISTPNDRVEPHPDDWLMLQEGLNSKLMVPFKTAKGFTGSFNLGHHAVAAYSDRDLTLLTQIVPHTAVIIENARFVDKIEQHSNRLKLLNHLGEMLVSITEPNRIVETTLNMLPRLLPSDVQAIVVASEEGAHLGMAVPYNFKLNRQIRQEVLDTFAEIMEENLSLDLISSKRIAGNFPVPNDWKPSTVLSLPLLTRQGTLGLIYIASGKEEALSNEMLRIFSLVVSQVSAVVENASLFRQVEQERARLAAILSSSTDAVLVVHRDGRIVLDNPAAWEVLGVDQSQRGRRLSECTTNQTLIDLFQTTMQGGKPNGEIPLGDGRTLFANLSPVSVGDSGIIGWVATMQDVSYFKELNELKNEFVNAVSHDLRSPLSSILLATHMMRHTGGVNESQEDLLATIERKVRTMSRLIQDLLDVGKIEAGIDMEMAPLSAGPIVTEVVSSLQSQADDKSVLLELQLSPNLPLIEANETRLQQVFHNLVGNAIKYTPEKGQVTIKAFPHDSEIRVQVIDTGLGIPAADQPHIFEKFYRVRGEHVESIKGTGLGLAITKSIVEKHGGRIWLESVFGEGSTFTTALPILATNQKREG